MARCFTLSCATTLLSSIKPRCQSCRRLRAISSVFALLIGFDELGYFGTCSDRLDQNNVARVQKHAIRSVPFTAPAHQYIAYRFGLLINRTLDVIHIGQLEKI